MESGPTWCSLQWCAVTIILVPSDGVQSYLGIILFPSDGVQSYLGIILVPSDGVQSYLV
jgi:hypothetical protein